MIYTSYFGNIKNIPNHIVEISIAMKSPTHYHGLEYKKLAPNYSFWKLWHDNISLSREENNQFYINCYYKEILDKLNIKFVIRQLELLSNNNDCVLLCYEKKGFCHRHLVREWFNKNGVECEEYNEKRYKEL